MKGFTLVEVLVVLVIAAILASIAYPSYGAYVIRTRRVEAQVHLLALLQAQEKHFSQANVYFAFDSDDADQPWWLGPSPSKSAYEFSAAACEGYTLKQCVRLRAEPGTAKVSREFVDPECGWLEADSLGNRRASGPHGRCWP
jgi:type IV pilus assembly protein PilE